MLYLAISLLSLILFIAIAQWFGLDVLKSLNEMASIGILGFIILAILTSIELVAKVFRFKYALSGNYSVKSLTLPYLSSVFLSFIIPSRFAGEGIRPLAFRSNPKIPAGECLSAVSIERIFDVIFLPFLLFGALSSLFNPLVPYVLVAGLAVFLAVATTGFFISATRLIPHKSVSSFFAEYFTALRKTLGDKRRFALISFFTILVWGMAFLRLWLILQYVGSSLPFFETASASAAAYLFSVLSILPGGGIFFEGGGMAALMFLGVASDKALSAMLLERFFAYWIFIIAGLLTISHYGNQPQAPG